MSAILEQESSVEYNCKLGTLRWTIHNMVLPRVNFKPGNYFESRRFRVDNDGAKSDDNGVWQVRFYPVGVGPFVHPSWEFVWHGDGEVNASCTIKVINHGQPVISLYTLVAKIFTTARNTCVLHSSVSTRDLLNPVKGYIQGASITIEAIIEEQANPLFAVIHKEDFEVLPGPSISSDMASIYESKEMCDAKLVVAGKEFPFHTAILGMRSAVFRRMFSTGMLESQSRVVQINDITPTVIDLLLKFVYTDQVKIGERELTQSLLEDLFKAGKKYNILGLVKWCQVKVMERISVKTAVEWLSLAVRLDDMDVQERCLNFIASNLEDVKNGEAWERLQADKQLSFHVMPLLVDALSEPKSKRARQNY